MSLSSSTDRGRPRFAVAVAAATALLALAAAPGWAVRNGEKLTFQGHVTGPQGRPLAGVPVVLEVSRTYLSLRHLERRQKDYRHVVAETNASGEYSLEWSWDGYFNTFALGVAARLEPRQDGRLELFGTVDVSNRLGSAGELVVPLVVQDPQALAAARALADEPTSADERRVFDRLGQPEHIEVLEVAGRVEVSWWYFSRGRVARFEDGKLLEIAPFDPVERF